MNWTSSAQLPLLPVQVAIRSDVGRVRQNNEDSAGCIRPADERTQQQKGLLAVVADGMGGHAAGEHASRLCVDTLTRQYYALGGSPGKALTEAIRQANQIIYQTADAQPGWAGMGTTCTAVAIVGDRLHWAQVGDSRAYLFRQGQLTHLTPDHTHVAELLQQGLLTPEQAFNHPDRNMLTRAVGTRSTVTPDVGLLDGPLLPNDRLLLCSDGLYEYLTDTELAHYLASMTDADACADALVNEANDRGGADNISAIVLDVASATPTDTTLLTTRDLELPAL